MILIMKRTLIKQDPRYLAQRIHFLSVKISVSKNLRIKIMTL